MIDINLLRSEKTRQKVIESERRRFRDSSSIDRIVTLEGIRTNKQYELEQNNSKINKLTKKISEIKKAKTDDFTEIEQIIKEINDLKERSSLLLNEVQMLEEEIHKLLKPIGNILHEDVVTSKDENDNKIIRAHQSKRDLKIDVSIETLKISPKFKILAFEDILENLKGVDTIRGSKLVGHRGYFLLEEIALLKNSLARYAVDFAREKGFILIQPPVLLRKSFMSQTAQLSDFDEQLYPVCDEFYLIATSEQPLSTMHAGERFSKKELPLKYVGESLCFRKEAGAHGKDCRGIFRVHQFDKIEQFIICSPDESEGLFNEMIKLSEDFYKSLDLSFRVVSIVSGEMNDAASIKYDLEAYFPHSERFRELVSCSNCTDFQSREANIRFGHGKAEKGKEFVHMLNCTLVAVQRTLCCLVENYQNENGVVVPEVLRPYMNMDFIPYKVNKE